MPNSAKEGDVPQITTLDKTKSEYAAKLISMTDPELFKETEQMIWLSLFTNNNPHSAYHWRCDASHDECQRRGRPDIYSRAHEKASSQ